ncbi:MAG: hypothetical protein ACE5H1_07975 [Thermodesulfobacteriota bacterium]
MILFIRLATKADITLGRPKSMKDEGWETTWIPMEEKVLKNIY